jgi:hypothetical protein
VERYLADIVMILIRIYMSLLIESFKAVSLISSGSDPRGSMTLPYISCLSSYYAQLHSFH